MSQPFLGEIRMFGCTFAPRGWAFCWGQTLAISQNSALFSLLGTQYGGNGQTTFALPDLRGRAPIHASANDPQGAMGGVENVTLITANLPPHTHAVVASSDVADAISPGGNRLAAKPRLGANVFAEPTNLTPLLGSSVSISGGSQPHNNTQPSLGVNFCIALEGIFPSRN
jgi:microcystin-dependent protein